MRYFSIILCTVINISCESGNRGNRNSSYESSKPIYIEYADSGFVKKYFDSDWNIIHDSTNASFFRTATYFKGQPREGTLVKDYYITGELQFEGYLSNENPDKPHGFTKWYYKNGNLHSTRNYRNGILNGLHRNYYENGRIKVRTRIIDDKIDGEYLEYYNSSKEPVKFKRHYSNGIPIGNFLEYFETGVIKEKKSFKNGELHGNQLKYHENGKLKESVPYVSGKLSGNYYEYFSNGNFRTKGYYCNNSECGDWIYYDKDGDLKKYSYITFRVGAICNDGTRSSATGRGACSWHGGVHHWLVRTEKRLIYGTGKYRNYDPIYNF